MCTSEIIRLYFKWITRPYTANSHLDIKLILRLNSVQDDLSCFKPTRLLITRFKQNRYDTDNVKREHQWPVQKYKKRLIVY